MAGNSFAFVLGMGTAMEHLSIGSYIEIHQSMDTTFSALTPMFYTFITLLIAANLYTIRKDWKSLEFMLVAFALICVLDELAMTWTIHSSQMMSPPSDWAEVRSQWLRFMYIRSALLTSGFGLLLASSFFMKKNLSSPRDVFAAV
ncbi:DUF1772 domain-containing protein [Bdellovibrio bacteriovorus]|uniref:DUF1772 domain-containing protein n=1 Tax=Bdellovibrio TaxID=958 RepID=UPI0035A8F7DF